MVAVSGQYVCVWHISEKTKKYSRCLLHCLEVEEVSCCVGLGVLESVVQYPLAGVTL